MPVGIVAVDLPVSAGYAIPWWGRYLQAMRTSGCRANVPSRRAILSELLTPAQLPALEAGLDLIRATPKDDGRLEMIVVRPGIDRRQVLDAVDVSPEGGLHGDRWVSDCWMHLPDGSSHPDAQITLMNARVLQQVAGAFDTAAMGPMHPWALAGDNLIADLDLSEANLPTGQHLRLGTAVLRTTPVPHDPCRKFHQRYGGGAVRFLNSEAGQALRMRGIYVRVVQAGRFEIGDRMTKID